MALERVGAEMSVREQRARIRVIIIVEIDRDEAHCTHGLESRNNSHQLPGDPDFGGGSRAVIRISFQYEFVKSYRD